MMLTRLLAVVIAGAVACSVCVGMGVGMGVEPAKDKPKGNDNALSAPVEKHNDLQYQLAKPAKVEKGKKLPLLVYLHGGGRRGASSVVVPPQLREKVLGVNAKMECFLLAPICPKNDRWGSGRGQPPVMGQEPSATMKDLLSLIDELLAREAIDPDRVYITGDQIGGDGALDAAIRRPDLFAAALPLGGTMDAAALERCAVPVYAFVETDDAKKAMSEPLQKGNAKSRVEKADGNVARDPWGKSGVLEWLFQQKRDGGEKKVAPESEKKTPDTKDPKKK